MLEVVEQQKQVLVRDVGSEIALGPKHPCRRLDHKSWVTQRCQRHPEHAIRVGVAGRRSGLQGEPRLTCPARAGQREEADVVALEQRQHLGELSLAAEERCPGDRQVRAVEALEGRELVVAELVDPLGRGQILQPMLTKVLKHLAIYERGGGGGHEHLTAMAAGGDPRGAVHVLTDVALIGEQGCARVETDPDGDRAALEPANGVCRGAQCPDGSREGDEEGVPLCIHLDATVSVKRRAQHSPVLCQRFCIPLRAHSLEMPRGTLHVGEQKGDRA